MDRSGIYIDPTRILLDSYKTMQMKNEAIVRSLDRSQFIEQMQRQAQPFEATLRSASSAYAEIMRQMENSISMFATKYFDDINGIQNSLRAFSERAITEANAYSTSAALSKLMQEISLAESWGKSWAERKAVLLAAQSPVIQEDAYAEIQKLNTIATDLDRDRDADSFFTRLEEFITKLPKPVKLLVLFIILPFIRDIAFDIVKPKVQGIIFGSKDYKSSKEIKKAVSKSLGSQCPREFLRDMRFVTTESLVVREYPKKRSKKYGNIKFGDVVSVLQIKKNWTLIEFSPADSQGKISGWVYSRYLGKFK
jgi:hypothetical protein